MDEQAEGQQGTGPEERYVVLQDGKKVATVGFVGDGDALKLNLKAKSGEVAEQLRKAFARKAGEDGAQPPASAPTKPLPSRSDFIKAVLKKIESLGFGVQPLPASDFQISIELDVDTGRRVAVASRLHEFAETGGIARDLYARLGNLGDTVRATMAQKISDSLAAGDAEAAAQAVLQWRGVGPFVGDIAAVHLHEIRRVPLDVLPATLREEMLELRLAVAARVNDLGGETETELKMMLDQFGASMKVERRAETAALEGALAHAKGYKATAIRHWKTALKGDDFTRGHALFNLSRAYPTGDLEAARYAELAADAMMQAGNPTQSVKCLHRLAECLLVRTPKQALSAIDRALGLLGDRLLDKDLKGGLLHYKALALEKLGLASAALDVAAQAAEERRDLIGAEEERQSSLALASILAENCGESERAVELKAEADGIADRLNDPAAKLRFAAGELALNYDSAKIGALREEAKKLDETAIDALLVTLKAAHEGTPEERIQWLEEALVSLRTAKAPPGDMEVVYLVLALELMHQGEIDLALRNYQEVLAINPFDQTARQNTVGLLHKSERWRDAAEFLEGQREIFGNRPGLLWNLGKSYLKLGAVNDAATTLMLSKGAAAGDKDMEARAEELLQQALEGGGKPDLTRKVAPPEAITHAQFEAALRAMIDFFAAEKRMSLWNSTGNGKHEWVERPEARAQDIVTTFLSGNLGKRAEVLEAVAAGAGFVDLYVVGDNGFRAIVELKMLGDPYTSAYAFAGENQIAHYMDQKKVSIGYLVIFDARKRDFGKRPEGASALGNKTIPILLVDVRPGSPSKQH